MSDSERIVVVVDRDPFASTKTRWVRILGVLRHDEITLTWTETTQNFWKWNIAVCLLDSANKEVVPVIVCNNARLVREVGTFLSISVAHLREDGFARLNRQREVKCHASLDGQDDIIREALGDALETLPFMRYGEIVALIRCEFLRRTLQGEEMTMASVHRIVTRFLRIDDGPAVTSKTASDGTRRKKTKRRFTDTEQHKEQRARLLDFLRLKTAKTYSFDESKTRAVVAPFSCRTFAPALKRWYESRGDHPGYLKTVTRYTDGLPPWDRVFVGEWTTVGVGIPPPRMDECTVLLQYPNDDGMGYSFASCDAAGLEALISTTEKPTFSEVYRGDLCVTAIPIDWDMSVDEVPSCTWNPAIWLERIEHAADAALRRLLPGLDTLPCKRRIVKTHMWISEEMTKKTLSDGSICLRDLDKITVHANLLLPSNVILQDYKVLKIVYEEMERQDGERSSWYLDKSITKLRLPGCFKRKDDGTYVRRLVPWPSTSANAFDALVHARHDLPPWEGIDMAILRSPSPERIFDTTTAPTKERFAYGHDVDLEKATEAIRFALSRMQETMSLELAPVSRLPFVPVRKREKGTNWCIIKGGSHSHATMYFVIQNRSRAWIHCHSDRCKTIRLSSKRKPYIDLSEGCICWQNLC